MILAAGRGERLRPLSALLPKPVMPVRGVPLLAYSLAWLYSQGIDQVALNLHHLPREVRRAAQRWSPSGMTLHFSEEAELLDTGGGIRRMAPFLCGSDPCLVLAGDMLIDFSLAPLLERHIAARRRATLLLRDDPRADRFGTIGIDAAGRLRRIADRFDLGGATRSAVYLCITLFSPTAFASMPGANGAGHPERFGHLDDWLAPELARGATDIGAEILDPAASHWTPIGTLDEYLAANRHPVRLSYWDGDTQAYTTGVRFPGDSVVGRGAHLDPGVHLEHTVVWEGERVPAGSRIRDGVFAGGRHHRRGEEKSR